MTKVTSARSIMRWMELFLPIFIILNFTTRALCQCYFPGELQGDWATQAAPEETEAPITYARVTISADEISTWGRCHAKIDGNIILADRASRRSAPCFRCFRLVVASVNVAVLLSGALGTCFGAVQDTLASCPTSERVDTHIILYKVRSSWGDSGLQETHCPFTGIHFFTLERGGRGFRGNRERCEQPTSELSNCPFGFTLSLQYRDCTFQDPRAASWHCLGSWKGLDGQHYTAFLDMHSKQGDGKPKYRCGIFKEDEAANRVFLSLSQDSTCTNGLRHARDGYDRYVLYSAPWSPLPTAVRDRTCRFPSVVLGRWHNARVAKSTIKYRDERFNTLRMQCVREFDGRERFAVYTRTDCGKRFFTCIWLKRRTDNVMEIMFGRTVSKSLGPELCNLNQFGNQTSWVTQARTDADMSTTCPIVGTYQGELPEAPGYCAELVSDCSRKSLMHYAVDECNKPSAVFEQREYECVGHWQEGEVVFALTRRRDIHTYECFVGEANPQGVVFLKEAGANCDRRVSPRQFGMKTVMKHDCLAEAPSPSVKSPPSVRSSPSELGVSWHRRRMTPTRPPWIPSTTRPWKPITGRPRKRTNSGDQKITSQNLIFLVSIVNIHGFLSLI